ncbi:MAG: nucleoside monophosphate kinase, partial [Candidatus Woesearchaeota archaeon]|nr:nucleoside monophosphate kinase [Candidatus Woesearchaeota archaeon]
LVSDEVVIQIVKDRLAKPDCQNGFILDGFPRTKPQAVALDTFAPPDFVIELSITDTEATKRMLNRRTCSKSGHIYNLYTMPKPKDPEKCDSDSSPLFQREDDQAEPIKERLKLYHKETAPLKTHFTNKGVLAKVNGKQSIEKVTKDILAVLK